MYRQIIAGLIVMGCSGVAHAAPPASCAGKFIGVWTHHGIAGQTNTGTLLADGRALCSDHPACV